MLRKAGDEHLTGASSEANVEQSAHRSRHHLIGGHVNAHPGRSQRSGVDGHRHRKVAAEYDRSSRS